MAGKNNNEQYLKRVAKAEELKRQLDEELRKANDLKKKMDANARAQDRKRKELYQSQAGKAVADMFYPMPIPELTELLKRVKKEGEQ